MDHALELARSAGRAQEVPVGALLVRAQSNEYVGDLVAAAANMPIATNDPSAHAEIEVLRLAGQALESYRLVNTTLYVTVEPCMMCAGALIHARIGRLVFGAAEPKAGAVVSHDLLAQSWLNHHIEVLGGVRETECGALMSQFFADRRKV